MKRAKGTDIENKDRQMDRETGTVRRRMETDIQNQGQMYWREIGADRLRLETDGQVDRRRNRHGQ